MESDKKKTMMMTVQKTENGIVTERDVPLGDDNMTVEQYFKSAFPEEYDDEQSVIMYYVQVECSSMDQVRDMIKRHPNVFKENATIIEK